MDKYDQNHNDWDGSSEIIRSDKLLESVRDGNSTGVKHLLEQGEDPNTVDEDGNTALHLAVIAGHYNIAVMLLNSDCDLELRNYEGWSPLQLCQRMEQRTVFSIAIQLSRRSRAERGRREERSRLIMEQKEESELEDEDEVDHTLMLTNRLHSTTQCLATARQSVTGLENQLGNARSLVNQLEMEVVRLRGDLERESNKKTRRKTDSSSSSSSLSLSLLDKCSVCLCVPRAPLMVFQCPEGHVFCSECRARPEMRECPECRADISGAAIRNRTLERLIAMASDQ